MKKIARKLFPELYSKLSYYNMLYAMKEFEGRYPGCKMFYSLFIDEERKIYSQHNQDYIVRNEFFRNKDDGVFCDVGGNHPLKINNTRYFEELGWEGLAFEPLPHMKDLWEKHRKAKLFSFAASDTHGEVVFSVVKNTLGWEDALSYIKTSSSPKYSHDTEEILVQTKPLKDVFEEESIAIIDYMSIDVEGHELNVLKGIDFDKVKINVLTIENNYGGLGSRMKYGDDNIREHMFKNNYILWGRIVGLDDIYVRKDYKH